MYLVNLLSRFRLSYNDRLAYSVSTAKEIEKVLTTFQKIGKKHTWPFRTFDLYIYCI